MAKPKSVSEVAQSLTLLQTLQLAPRAIAIIRAANEVGNMRKAVTFLRIETLRYLGENCRLTASK